jgi:general secretion pathway protein G
MGYGPDAVVYVILSCSCLAYCHFRLSKRYGGWLLILGFLFAATALLMCITQPVTRSWYEQARVQMRILANALEHYKQDNGFYPTTEQGLRALVRKPTTAPLPRYWPEGGYLDTTEMPYDPWGVPYIYLSPGQHGAGYTLKSLGEDQREGGQGHATDLESQRGP